MLTPEKIHELFTAANKKHTQPQYGMYPPQKRIMEYVSRQMNHINNNRKIGDVSKVQEMTNMLEGFIRYLNESSKILKLDIDKILTYIYYPEDEEVTLDNKDNLMIGSKAGTVRIWHDAYNQNNKEAIINRLIDCKNVLFNKFVSGEYIKERGIGMPEPMHRKYQEMFELRDKPEAA